MNQGNSRRVYLLVLPLFLLLAVRGVGQDGTLERQLLHRLAYPRNPAAGWRLLAILGKTENAETRKKAVDAVKRVLPFQCLPALSWLAAKAKGAKKKQLLKLVEFLDAARTGALPLQKEISPILTPAELAALQQFVGPTSLVVTLADLDGKALAGALVRVWSYNTACWHPLSISERPIYAKTDKGGVVRMKVPPGPLVVAAWTPNMLVWRAVSQVGSKAVNLQPETQMRIVESGWRNPQGRIEAWPSGPFPSARFPAWLVDKARPLFVSCCKDAPLDLLVMAKAEKTAGADAVKARGLHLFVRNVSRRGVHFPIRGKLRVGGAKAEAIENVAIRLSPRLRPDLERLVRLPHAGAVMEIGAGSWRARLSWERRGWGKFSCYPQALNISPTRTLQLPLQPLHGSIYARREKHLGNLRNVLSARLLLRTPGGAVVHQINQQAKPVRGTIKLISPAGQPGPIARMDGSMRVGWGNLADSQWQAEKACYQVHFPFTQLRIRGLQARVFKQGHFSLTGPFHLQRKADSILAMAELSLLAMQSLTPRRPGWDLVPVLGRNHLPPGFRASATGGEWVDGHIDFKLHSLLQIALPGDIMQFPWLHELAHKVGFRHGPAMTTLLVETAYTMLGREGIRCAGTFNSKKLWELACGKRKKRPQKSRRHALIILRRVCGARPLQRYLSQEPRLHWFLEGEGFSVDLAMVAALAHFAKQPLGGFFKSLGWHLSMKELTRAKHLLSMNPVLPPSGLAAAETAFAKALKGSSSAVILARLMNINNHRQRAFAAHRALQGYRGGWARREALALVRIAQKAANLAGTEISLNIRSKVLASWARRVIQVQGQRPIKRR